MYDCVCVCVCVFNYILVNLEGTCGKFLQEGGASVEKICSRVNVVTVQQDTQRFQTEFCS